MPRYAAFLRGVSPTNARMPVLQTAFERAGCTNVRTLLTSGNVVFDSRARSTTLLRERLERAMGLHMDRSFSAFVRPLAYLQDLLQSDPFAGHALPADVKCVIAFLREPVAVPVALPPERHGARILRVAGTEAFACYVPGPKAPAFMGVLERVFGSDITTRTLETVRKCAVG